MVLGHFLLIFLAFFFLLLSICLSTSASSSSPASSWRFASFGFWCLHPIYLHLCLRRQSDSGLGLGLCLGLVFCSCAVGVGGGAAAVSGKCYLTASVTLHNCSHFLDCATVAVAALRCLNLLLFCLSCRISGATDGVRAITIT